MNKCALRVHVFVCSLLLDSLCVCFRLLEVWFCASMCVLFFVRRRGLSVCVFYTFFCLGGGV